ncbi:MAG: hypothetical protein WC878_04150 [Candidatus Paceibacterota bacterium]|jgi:hypothetical protein
MEARNEVFKDHLEEWLKAKGDRKARALIGKLMALSTKCHPKSVSRTFKRIQTLEEKPERRGRPRYYAAPVIAALREVWKAGDRGCGEVIHPMIREYVSAMRRDNQWKHGDVATAKLFAMSERTVKRRVLEFRKESDARKHGKSGTSPSALKNIIPIRKGPWKDTVPGDGQLDTVALCGDSLAGSFIWGLNYTDIATYWTVIRCQWNKGQEATKENVIAIRKRLPFPLLALHPDSGGEFINWVLKDWCDAEKIMLSRSEPYKKNDNMCVEERNGHVIRRYLGWERLDVLETLPLANELCDTVNLYTNHWKAVRRMIKKERIGAKYKRTYEKRAMTPYERVLARNDITEDVKEKLRKEHETLNPLALLRKIAILKKKIYELTKAARERTND